MRLCSPRGGQVDGRVDGRHAQANDAVWRRREPSREARTPCENGRWTSRESAGDQGCARTALRLVQRRTEEVRGRAKDRPHGRDVTFAPSLKTLQDATEI